ncbi:MAG: gentisate 1,2-dioxygenase [Acidobacteria bacterium RIFCSPLOWO2_02_FULL_68_18]|nr:MAG: gentisate 1,2-dioxygenase [Acidobacteria bacterium RIFCSPLOWO2_02_FULL_68_18]OFW51476.1 MAG: gentisate 1,2-dioxygenase [Acidobacteria bacterium RIFCSPLOWO2_12_FULL_68_19]
MDHAAATARSSHLLPPERRELYARLDTANTAPLWEVLGKIIPPEPAPDIVAVLWRYEEVRPLLLEAGRLLTAREAERRVLVLENPGLRGQSRVTTSLYAGLQLILPGEIAPAHRHSMAALRFVMEGTGAYTAVEGERTVMHPGDFILTPSWTYHDHGNPADVPVVWLDGLDVPIVNLFDASFRESYPGDIQSSTVPDGDSDARYAANMLPVDWAPARPSSPIFNYPYSRSRETLETLFRHGSVHQCHGVKMRFINPATGGAPMPTIGAFMQLLPKGFTGARYRATDSTVFAVAEGRGRSRIGDRVLAWGPRDVFVAPSWTAVAHEAEDEAVLFSFSDRPVQQVLGLWREEAPLGR